MSEATNDYVHGYDEFEQHRLDAQASSVWSLLHDDTRYAPGSRVLEVGCGTGAQTITLARNSPGAQFVSFDRSAVSLEHARARLEAADLHNVELRREELFALPFEHQSFDHLFVCFVLEHLPDPVAALRALQPFLKPDGTITVFEGDHGSAYFHPESDAARRVTACQVELQRRAGGNAMIGRQVYPLMIEAGFEAVVVTPRVVYVDASRPRLVESFTLGTFTAMMQGVREPAIAGGLIDAESFDAGIHALERTAAADGVFCYTFFKGVGRNRATG
jgi:ubiquinone/menaquinone biosynthesis C-methylase UbiE